MTRAQVRRLVLRAAETILVALVVLGLLGSWLAPSIPEHTALAAGWLRGAGPTVAAIAVVATVAFCVGLGGGAAAALGPSAADAALSRSMEIAGGLPSLVVVVLLRSLHPSPGIVAVGVVLAVLRGLETAKGIRAELIVLRTEEFVVAARALGTSQLRLFRCHLLPHVMGSALSGAAFSAAAVVGLDAAVSYVGLGGSTGWGALLAEAARTSWTSALPPALGVAATVASLLVVADALEDQNRVGRRWA